MTQEQFEYIDEILPLYGCESINDSTSLINKSTIRNWKKLKTKINNDMPKIKEIFPTKSLNLTRFNYKINTEQQAIALLRGLFKIVGISYTIVRKTKSEYMRLNTQQKTLMYYIIHKNMEKTGMMEVPVNEALGNEHLKITKKFYVKFDGEKPEKSKFKLVCCGDTICSTNVIEYDDKCKMWEIKFFTSIVALDSYVPEEFTGALFFNKLAGGNAFILTKCKCKLFIEYYMTDLIFPNSIMTVYVKYANPTTTSSDNLLKIGGGMMCMTYQYTKLKYQKEKKSVDHSAHMKNKLINFYNYDIMKLLKDNTKSILVLNPDDIHTMTIEQQLLCQFTGSKHIFVCKDNTKRIFSDKATYHDTYDNTEFDKIIKSKQNKLLVFDNFIRNIPKDDVKEMLTYYQQHNTNIVVFEDNLDTNLLPNKIDVIFANKTCIHPLMTPSFITNEMAKEVFLFE